MLLALRGALVDGMIVSCGYPLRRRIRETVHSSTLMYFSYRLYLLIRSSMPKFPLNDQSFHSIEQTQVHYRQDRDTRPGMHDDTAVKRKTPTSYKADGTRESIPYNDVLTPSNALHT
jgi:hypothetical protein